MPLYGISVCGQRAMALQIHSGKPQTSCHPHRERMPQKMTSSFFGGCYSFQELLVSPVDAVSSTTRQAHWFPSLIIHRLVDAFAPHRSKRAVSEAGLVVGVGIPQEARQAWSFRQVGGECTDIQLGRLRTRNEREVHGQDWGGWKGVVRMPEPPRGK